MADFNVAYPLTMKVEGGYINDPDDTGGETFKGVSRNNNPKWSGWATIDAIKATNPPNLTKALNQHAGLLEQIMNFYIVNYWNVNKTGSINDQQIANQVFDTAVNCGTGTAAKFLQQAAGVAVDLKVGPLTIAAVNAAVPVDFYNQFIALRKQYYLNIIARNPTQAKFQKSWFSRLWPYKTLSSASPDAADQTA